MKIFFSSIVSGLLMLWFISIITFGVIHAMPMDPAEATLLEFNIPATPENIAALKAEWGLDRPLIGQYFSWLFRFVKGDWGTSFVTDKPIFEEFMVRLPYSLIIGLGGLVTAGLLAVPFGLYSSLRPGGWIDKASRILVVATQSLPTFWVGLILIWLFAVKTQLLKPFTGNLFERLILPTALVTLYSLGALTRVYRRELQLAIDQPFFTVAIAKGLSRRNAVFRHAGRPALFGLLAAFTPECAWIVGGTAVVEVVFAVPGISEFLVESIRFRDYFVLQAYIVVIGIWMLGIHFVAGLLRQMLDPRSS